MLSDLNMYLTTYIILGARRALVRWFAYRATADSLKLLCRHLPEFKSYRSNPVDGRGQSASPIITESILFKTSISGPDRRPIAGPHLTRL